MMEKPNIDREALGAAIWRGLHPTETEILNKLSQDEMAALHDVASDVGQLWEVFGPDSGPFNEVEKVTLRFDVEHLCLRKFGGLPNAGAMTALVLAEVNKAIEHAEEAKSRKAKAQTEAILNGGRPKAWERKDETIKCVRACIDNYKGDPGTVEYRTALGKLRRRQKSKRQAMIEKITAECKISGSYVYELERENRIEFPEDAKKRSHKK